MHIPDHMLEGSICPVTAAVSALGLAGVAFAAARMKEKPGSTRFAAVAAFIFAAQMMNFPVQNGTSGHLLGGVLASALLGVPFGVLATALVLLIQCLIFSDGGITVLGANILNMALIGAGLGGLLFKFLSAQLCKGSLLHLSALGMASWLSVIMAALACSIELGLSGVIAFSRVAGAMIGVHAMVGIGEALITVVSCQIFSAETAEATPAKSVLAPLTASVLIAVVLSPFASGFPDGLEWVAEKYRFLHEAAPAFVSPLADYAVPAVNNVFLSTSLAGLSGVLLTFLAAWGLARCVSAMKLRAAA